MPPPNGIPIKNYFDADIYNREMQLLFKNNAEYLGADSMVHEEGDWRVLVRTNESKLLSLKEGTISLLDNICAHRQAKMLTGYGNNRYITCPYHRWTYEHGTGKCVRTPLYKDEKVEAALGKTPITHWKNLIFSGATDFGKNVEAYRLLDQMQIEKMIYKKTVSEKLNYNWKHYIDVYGENYHVPFIHPGFSSYLDLSTMAWEEHPHYHAQIVKPRSLEYLKHHRTTAVYKRWIDLLLEYYEDNLPEHAGLLLLYYPNIMIECYPLYMIISTIHPTGPETSVLHTDYFHHADVFDARPDIVEAAEAAGAETMQEDADICDRTAEGRKFLYEQGREEQGPYQAPYEDGLAMFHRYYHRTMGHSGNHSDG